VWSNLLAKQKTPVYLYYFTKDNGSLGNAHGGEMPYAYGNLKAHDWLYTDEDYRLSELMMDCWVNFVRCGDPNGEYAPLVDTANPHWDAFNAAPE
jgi:para-nitrobenzyl esterase